MKFIIILSLLFSLALLAQEIDPISEELDPTADEAVENFSPMPDESALIQSNEEGIALDGFDTVAYFNQQAAVRGVAQYNCEYQNKTWYFSSAENRDAFLSNPEKFTPQYGGFCAHSLTNNKLVKSNPESFGIRDNKLYLYLNDNVAEKDIKKKDNIFADTEKKRQNYWVNYENRF